jgi:hypothetical protein
VDSRAEAIELGQQFVRVDGPHRLKVSELELRQFFELTNFAPGNAVDRYARLRAEMAQR